MEYDHKEHMFRTIAIGVMILLMGGAVIYLHVNESAIAFRSRIEGALALLFPALLDSLRVANRQRRVRKESLRPKEAT